MERRLSILRKSSKNKDEQESDTQSRSQRGKPDSITRLTRSDSTNSINQKSRSRSSSVEPVLNRRHSNSKTSGTSNTLEISHKAPKRTLDDTNHTSMSKKARSSSTPTNEHYILTRVPYNGLGLTSSYLQCDDISSKEVSVLKGIVCVCLVVYQISIVYTDNINILFSNTSVAIIIISNCIMNLK